MHEEIDGIGWVKGGTDQTTAGSQLPQGDRRCPECDARPGESHHPVCSKAPQWKEVGSGVEPKGASRPGASVLGPTVPSLPDARRAAEWHAKKRKMEEQLLTLIKEYHAFLDRHSAEGGPNK
jgi:hypothetical protein